MILLHSWHTTTTIRLSYLFAANLVFIQLSAKSTCRRNMNIRSSLPMCRNIFKGAWRSRTLLHPIHLHLICKCCRWKAKSVAPIASVRVHPGKIQKLQLQKLVIPSIRLSEDWPSIDKMIAYLQWTMPDGRGEKIAVPTIIDVYASFPILRLDNTQKENIASSLLNVDDADLTYYIEWRNWARHTIPILPHLCDQQHQIYDFFSLIFNSKSLEVQYYTSWVASLKLD